MFWPKVLAEVWFGDRALTLQEKQGTQSKSMDRASTIFLDLDLFSFKNERFESSD